MSIFDEKIKGIYLIHIFKFAMFFNIIHTCVYRQHIENESKFESKFENVYKIFMPFFVSQRDTFSQDKKICITCKIYENRCTFIYVYTGISCQF